MIARKLLNIGYLSETSSCLGKIRRGVGFPLQIESLDDGVDDAVHALCLYSGISLTLKVQ